jgi:ABC-type ATPase involved in cell division
MRINNLLGKTVIVVTHDLGLVKRYGHRVIRLDEGKIDSDLNLPCEAEIPADVNLGGVIYE